MLRNTILVIAAALAASSPAQVQNDHCATAIPIQLGVYAGSTAGATTGPEPTGPLGAMGADVWYEFIAPCTGPYTATTCHSGTDFDTVLALWDGTLGCALIGGGFMQCADDGCGVAAGGPFLFSEINFDAVAGTYYYLSVGGAAGATGNFALHVRPTSMELQFFDVGPGTLGYALRGGPVSGTAFTAITGYAGGYPNGWFFGIDIGLTDLMTQLAIGFPFIVPLDTPCGDAVLGPVYGVPSGLTVFGVSIGIPPSSDVPLIISNPHYKTVP